MRLRPATLALLALTTAAQPCSAEQLPQITLKGGEGQTIPDTGVTLLLTGITDQRCPAGVDCYWEGMIRAEITVLGPKPELMEIILCNLCDDGSRDAKVAGVSLTLLSLAPSTEDLAKLGREPRLTDYALTVTYGPANQALHRAPHAPILGAEVIAMSWLSRLAERQIQKARLSGQLQGLEGEGKPLPDRPGDAFVSPGDAVGFRIMAQAGVLPEEITLKKKVAAQRAHLAPLTDATERKAAMTELSRLEMLQAIAEESRRKFLR